MEMRGLVLPQVDGELLEAIAYVHEAGRVFGKWSDQVRREHPDFWDFYSEDIIRVSGGLSDAETGAAFLAGMKLPYDSAEGKEE